MVVMIVSTLTVMKVFATFVADRYLVTAVFCHLHLPYSPQAGGKHFIAKSRLDL